MRSAWIVLDIQLLLEKRPLLRAERRVAWLPALRQEDLERVAVVVESEVLAYQLVQ